MTLLACCLLAAGLTLLIEPRKRQATLTDGTVVRFEQAGIGQISFDSYPPVKAVIARYVPNRFQHQLGERFQGSLGGPSNNQLGFLFSLWGTDGKRKDDPTRFLSRIEFVESTGYVFRSQVSGYTATGNMILFHAAAIPHRDQTLTIRCFGQDWDRLLFDLTIPNPGYQPSFSEWSPEPAPASKTVAPLTVTLKHELDQFTKPYLQDHDIDVTSTDPRWTNTKPQRQFWLTDVTGNRSNDLQGLSPFEPAWKLSLVFRRNAEAEFSEEEIWRTKLFALPAPLTAEKLALKNSVSGIDIAAQFLSSAGTTRIEGDSITVTTTSIPPGRGTSEESGTLHGRAYRAIHSGLPFLELTHSILDDETELQITVRDQIGNVISVPTGSWSLVSGQSTRIIQLEPKPESSEIQLEFIVNRGRKFEFLVAPPTKRLANPESL